MILKHLGTVFMLCLHFLQFFMECFNMASSSSSPITSDLSYDWPVMGPGTTGSSPKPAFDGHFELSVLMKAPTTRLMACAKQLLS